MATGYLGSDLPKEDGYALIRPRTLTYSARARDASLARQPDKQTEQRALAGLTGGSLNPEFDEFFGVLNCLAICQQSTMR